MPRAFSGLMFILLLISVWTLTFKVQPAKAGTIAVPDDYPTIQTAIDAAIPGTLIDVRAGVYYEHVIVNKAVALVGDGWMNTTIDGQEKGNVVSVVANNVVISGFMVQNGQNGIVGCSSEMTCQKNLIRNNGFGVCLQDCISNSFSDNIIVNNGYGLVISPSSDNITMRRNALADNGKNFDVGSGDNAAFLSGLDYDIDTSNTINGKPIYYLVNSHNFQVPADAGFVAAIDSSNITVEGMSLADNNHGVLLVRSSNCSVINVNATGNVECGIYIFLSDNNTVVGCQVNGSSYGIKIWHSNNNRILRSVVRNCGSFGIVLHGPPCNQNEMAENILLNDGIGIHLGGFCTNDTIEKNVLVDNGIAMSTDWFGNVYRENSIVKNDVGFYQFGSSGNRIFHNNFIDNKQQVLPPGKNVWDDGYPSGGNYWSGYYSSDLFGSQYQNETGSDGIGDTPYIIDANNLDNYPLMSPWTLTSLVGDLNGDDKVSLLDLQLLANSYNSKPGDSNWNLMADLAAPYEIISLTDLVTLAMHYGEHNP